MPRGDHYEIPEWDQRHRYSSQRFRRWLASVIIIADQATAIPANQAPAWAINQPASGVLLGNDGADVATAAPNKIWQAIAKERRASSFHLESLYPGEQMKKDTSRHRSNAAESARIRKARNFIHAYYGEDISLGKVAKAAHTSANYLSEKFKEATGITFVRYVAQTRYEKAAKLLREADLRVSEIAFAVGFQSLSQFNRVFKKFCGKSPTDYRTEVRRREKRRH